MTGTRAGGTRYIHQKIMQVREHKREDVLFQLELDIVILEEDDLGFTVKKTRRHKIWRMRTCNLGILEFH